MSESAERRRPTVAVQIGQLEEVMNGMAEDIRSVRLAATEGLRHLDNRLHDLEDVRVRALEDWRLSQRVLEKEREKVRTEQSHRAVTRRDVWVAVAAAVLLCAATIVAPLIAAHAI